MAYHQGKAVPDDIPENPLIFSDTYRGLFTEFEHRCLTLVTLKDLIFPKNYTFFIDMPPTSTDVYFLDEIF